VTDPPSQPLFWSRVDVHDKKQLELKLEYEPSVGDQRSRYLVEAFLFIPSSLNVNAETYPRDDFYADIHNYVRLKTPVLDFAELLQLEQSPLVKLERKVESLGPVDERDAVYQAKLLSCIYRAALRRVVRVVDDHCQLAAAPKPPDVVAFQAQIESLTFDASKGLTRFRAFMKKLFGSRPLQEKTRASLRLVDEFMSLSVEQFFRKSVADMDRLPRTGAYIDIRKELMAEVIREEDYRKENRLKSVLSPTGDNEQYMHRIGFLKKFSQNILFLSVRRQQARQGVEEMLFAVAAGFAMAFATAVAFWAQLRYAQLSLNFFLVVVVGYMMKDRIKEGLRRIFHAFAARHLFDRKTVIVDPVTQRRVGLCQEKLDYGGPVPGEIRAQRQLDDIHTVSEGELAETVLRYQKQIVLASEMLPHVSDGISGVTDIVRLNVDHLCHDMDDPEYAIEYVDLEDLTVGRVKGAKSYEVDLALRFSVGEGERKEISVQLYRLVLDRNGIKRLVRVEVPASPSPVRSVA